MFKPARFGKIPKFGTSRKGLSGLASLVFLSSFVGIGLAAKPTEKENVPAVAVENTSVSNENVGQTEQTPEVEGVSTENPEAVEIIETPTSSPVPTIKPTSTPTKTPTKVPTRALTPTTYVYVAPTSAPIQNNGGSWECNCSLTCGRDITSCAEAQYLLNICGCSARDADHDGIACDSAPLNCQN